MSAVDSLGHNEAGRLNNAISIDVNLAGEPAGALYYLARDWAGARQFLRSAEFAAVADRVESVVLTNREAP